MSTSIFLRGFVTLILSAILAFGLWEQNEAERSQSGMGRRYGGYISGSLLPGYVLALLIVAWIILGEEAATRMTLTLCFGVFLHICLYYLLLLPALPLLRRRFDARSCAVLWMLPNYLYLTQMSYMELPAPRWVIRVPSALVGWLLAVWLAGFLAVLGWKIVSHLVFRGRILKRAVPATDPKVLEVWRRELENARVQKPRFQLVLSPDVETPLSVGLFQSSLRVVLPMGDHTEEELAMILRHELVHIGRGDAWSKFFLVFCTAMCWFDPLMWVAAKKSAEDLELSCDETVLLEAEEGERGRYAQLLLRTVGDERGFTTCLSASAQALRYRLKNVVKPGKKRSGALVVGLVFFLLVMSCGYVALAYGENTGAELIYQGRGTEEYALEQVGWCDNPHGAVLVCTDEAALGRYLSSLRMERITGNYSFEEGRRMFLLFNTPEGILDVGLSDRSITLAQWGQARDEDHYYLPEETDWTMLREWIVECPTLEVRLTGIENEARSIRASLWRAELVEGEELRPLYRMEDRETPGGIYGYPARRAELSFSLPLRGECEVEAVPLGKGEGYTLCLEGTSPAWELWEGAFQYIVRCELQGEDGRLYRAEFRFEVGPL